MNSLAQDVDGYSIAAQVRMERQTHKGSFLLLEGSTDIRRISKFVDEHECSMVNCYGKKNLIDAIVQLYEDGFSGALGLVDSDFDDVIGQKWQHEGLIYSESHDFDLDIALSDAFARYVNEVGDEAKLKKFASVSDLRSELLSSIKPLSVLRFANEKDGLGYRLKGLRHYEFFNGNEVDIGGLVEHVSVGTYSGAHHKLRLVKIIEKHVRAELDLKKITNGHDVAAALGIMLQDRIGSRAFLQTRASEVELGLRLAYDRDDFCRTSVFVAIQQWEADNPPYIVLKWHLSR